MYPYATCRLGICAHMALTATKILYFNNFCSYAHMLICPLWVQMRRRQWAYRSTPSAFLTHVSTNLRPVKPIALLMVWNFFKAWCRHVAFVYRAVARCRTWVLTAVFVSIAGRKCERQVYCFWVNLSCKQQFVTGYALTFAMPIGFLKVINLNQTEHQVEATYDMPFLLPCLLIWHFTTGANAYQTKQQDEAMYALPVAKSIGFNFYFR